MDLINHTPFVAEMLRAQLHYRDLIMATLICKVTFEVDREGQVRLAATQRPLIKEPQPTPLGTTETDIVPIKFGCDLTVYGHARSLGQRPETAVPVRLKVGDFERLAMVHGDRTWRRSLGGYAATPPVPFTAMPLTPERAYGGGADGDALEISHDNPHGGGGVPPGGEIEGTRLPNLEELDPRQHPLAQRIPATFGSLPRASGLRGMRGASLDEAEGVARLSPLFFNDAHPRMILRQFPRGEVMHVDGMSHEGRWSFPVLIHDLEMQVQLGGRTHEVPLIFDTLSVWPDLKQFSVVARRAVMYQFLPERIRSIVLRVAHRSAPAIPPTLANLRATPDPQIPIELAAGPGSLAEIERAYPFLPILDMLPVCASA